MPWRWRRKGGAYVDRDLFNGRYYAQKLALDDRSVLEPFDQGRKAGVLRDSFMEAYWSDEYGEIKYQIGGGCLTDQILGQWHADMAGLGDLLSPDNVRTALKSIFGRIFGRRFVIISIRAGFTPMRTRPDFSSAPGRRAPKPAAPVPYSEEVWTGLEYMMASHLIARGLRR